MQLFQWDEAKAASNKRKHGISFEEAMLVFDDPYSISEPERTVDGEIRWQTMGIIDGLVVVVVIHTIQEQGADEIVRIISARPANRVERNRYGQNRYENFG